MDKKVRVLMPIEVPCLDENIDIASIRKELNDYARSIIPKINIQDLGEWKFSISILSRSTDGIGIYKRLKRYPSDKEFEIFISISIPDDDQASYGFAKVKESYYLPLDSKNFYILKPHFENYANLYQYVFESAKHAIDIGFVHGFTCNGKRIKFQK